MPLGQGFDERKAVEAILYIAARVGDPGFHRISKLLYFADKKHLARYGSVIAGDDYVAMRLGPVPSNAYNLMKAVKGVELCTNGEEAAKAFAVVDDFMVRPLREANLDFLSEADIESLDAAIRDYGSLSFNKLTDLSHDAAWKAADQNDRMDIEDIARASDDSETVVSFVRDRRAGHA